MSEAQAFTQAQWIYLIFVGALIAAVLLALGLYLGLRLGRRAGSRPSAVFPTSSPPNGAMP